jgi:hypothetical protein
VKQVLAQALVAPGTGRTGGPDPEREARTAEDEAAAPDDLVDELERHARFPGVRSPRSSGKGRCRSGQGASRLGPARGASGFVPPGGLRHQTALRGVAADGYEGRGFHAPAVASDGDAAQYRGTAPTRGPPVRTGFRQLTMPATARHLVLLQGRGRHRRVLGAETLAADVAAGVSFRTRSVLRPVHVRSTRREQRRGPTAASLTHPPHDKPASRRITATPQPLNPYVQPTRGDQGECREQALRRSRGAVSQRHVRRGSVDARTGHDVDPQGVP